jgi:hypothetical protein
MAERRSTAGGAGRRRLAGFRGEGPASAEGEGRRQRLFVIVGGDCVRAGMEVVVTGFQSCCLFLISILFFSLLFPFFFFFCPQLLIFISPAVVRRGKQNIGCSNFLR